MLFVFPKAVRGALTNMIFILATVTQKGKGSYHRDHPPEQVGIKTDTKAHLLGAHNWTSPSMEGAWHLGNATTDAPADDIMYVGYGRDPWGPSTLMSSEEAGVGGSGRRGRGRGRGSSNSQRPRRNVVHLYNMVSCATGCNPITYKGYGCYCGFLGSGAPIDGIDRCCKMHDWCYNTSDCPMFFEYFVPYLWKCYHHRPLCAIDHGIYGGPGSCAQRLCECDRLLSECLSHYRCPKRRAVCRSSPVRFLIQSLFTF